MSSGWGLPIKCRLALAAQVAVGHIHGRDASATCQQLISFPIPWSRQFWRLWRCRGCVLWGLEEGTGEQSNEGLRYHRVHGK